jgi:hypothetical protein
VLQWATDDADGADPWPFIQVRTLVKDETGSIWEVGANVQPGPGGDQVLAVALGATCEEAIASVQKLIVSWSGAVSDPEL